MDEYHVYNAAHVEEVDMDLLVGIPLQGETFVEFTSIITLPGPRSIDNIIPQLLTVCLLCCVSEEATLTSS
jgi:hypothetical protein